MTFNALPTVFIDIDGNSLIPGKKYEWLSMIVECSFNKSILVMTSEKVEVENNAIIYTENCIDGRFPIPLN